MNLPVIILLKRKFSKLDEQSPRVSKCKCSNIKKGLQDKNFKYTFGDAKKFFDTADMKKAAVTEFKNTFVPQNIRENLL